MATMAVVTLDRLRDGVRDNPWISWGVTLAIGLLAFVGTVAAARFIERDLRDGDR